MISGLISVPVEGGRLLLVWPDGTPRPAACFLGSQSVSLEEARRLLIEAAMFAKADRIEVPSPGD